MLKNAYRWGLAIICMLLIFGCDAALVRGGRVIGVHSGHFINTDGYLRMNYQFPLDTVWAACQKAVVDMKGARTDRDKKIASGTITAIIQDEKVTIVTEYVSKDMTTVSVLVGLAGNNIASQLIHEKIGMNLLQSIPSQGSNQTKGNQ
jgi:hypothetical protein